MIKNYRIDAPMPFHDWLDSILLARVDSGGGGPQPPIEPPRPEPIDALAENARGFRVDGKGKLVGVQMGIHRVAHPTYRVRRVRLIDEYEAQGQTVAFCSVYEDGIQTHKPVIMAWPWGKFLSGSGWDNSAPAGNPNNQHTVASQFAAPGPGPLCFLIGNPGAPESDIVYGAGQVSGYGHISFEIVFEKI